MSNLFNKIAVSVSTIAMVAASFAFVGADVNAAAAGEVYKTADGTVWFVDKSMTKRPFTSWGAFLTYGFLNQGMIKDADSSVTSLPTGEFVKPADGQIFCATATKGTDVAGECALITGGKKAAFVSSAVFTAQGFSFANANYGDSSFLEKTSNVENGGAAHLPGTLVNNGGTVQMVVSGGLWGIPSQAVFDSWGYSYSDVVMANAADKALTQVGVIPGRMAGELVPTGTTSDDDDDDNQSCSDPLEGTAGDITVSNKSTYSAEDVGEGEEEAPVYSFEVEADNDSDVEVTSVKVELAQGTAADSEDIEDYISEVSIWLDGEMVGSADADEFNEESDVYSKNISLDCAVVRADESEDFVIAVSAIDNIDGSDIDSDAWYVGVSQVRFEDADGVSTTESFTLDVADDTDDDTLETTFDFETYAGANDVELKAALGTSDEADDINEAHVINVDDTNDTDEVEILDFTLEADGDSDINVTEIPVLFTITEAAGTDHDDPDDILTTATLWMDGDDLATESFVATDANGNTETITFEDLDIDIDAGDKAEFVVTVDVQDTGTALDNGDTLKAEITGTEVDLIEAEDETGEELTTTDLTGTALGEASAFYDEGIMVELVETDSTVDYGDPAATNDHDLATFTFTFDVTAFDGDAYIDNTDPALTGGGTAHDLGLNQGSGTVVDADIEAADDTIEATNSFLVEEGTTERFTITVIITPTSDGLFQLDVDSILYAPEASGDVDGTIDYTFDLDDFRSDAVYLNNDAA